MIYIPLIITRKSSPGFCEWGVVNTGNTLCYTERPRGGPARACPGTAEPPGRPRLRGQARGGGRRLGEQQRGAALGWDPSPFAGTPSWAHADLLCTLAVKCFFPNKDGFWPKTALELPEKAM